MQSCQRWIALLAILFAEITSTASVENTTSSNSRTADEDPYVHIKTLYLERLVIDTEVHSRHTVTIPYYDFVYTEKCYIVTPQGRNVDLEFEVYPGIKFIQRSDTACGVIVDVDREAQVGEWFLISRETRMSEIGIFERQQPFAIKVTEEVNAVPSNVTVNQDKNFYVRLENGIPNPECKLLGPKGSEYRTYEVDPRYPDKCGFVVRNVNETDQGIWKIVYGQGITYEARFQVTVHTSGGHGQHQFTWIRDRPVQEIFGSEDIIYCKIIDPNNFVAFEGFGRCNITLPRAGDEHEGTWKMFVGVSGRILTEESTFTVEIANESPKAKVKTETSASRPIITLACSVSTPYEMRACKFRDTSGRILMANLGVGEDRYSFYGGGSRNQSGVFTHHCGIQIRDPIIRDLGFWRCAIQTRDEAYYGFLKAWAPWLTRDPEVAAGIQTEPWLRADRKSVEAIEGDNVLMSCSIQTAIRYCYFRAPNATVYTVGPGFSSTDMAEYAGAGLDAGECSIRFRSLNDNDGGYWTCHVGFLDNRIEQQASIDVNVTDIMRVRQVGDEITIVVDGRQLDYCRFVRSDGLGFTHDESPWKYDTSSHTSLELGVCSLRMIDPDMLDRQPWTVVARIAGHNEEITRTTNGHRAPPPPPFLHRSLQTLWMVFLVSGIIMILLGVMLGSKSNRNWTYTQAAGLRQSFRQRFAKKAAVEANATVRSTANAA